MDTEGDGPEGAGGESADIAMDVDAAAAACAGNAQGAGTTADPEIDAATVGDEPAPALSAIEDTPAAQNAFDMQSLLFGDVAGYAGPSGDWIQVGFMTELLRDPDAQGG
eukprot:2384301-Prymnesium_polylepis.1